MRDPSSSISRFVREAYNELRSAVRAKLVMSTTERPEIRRYMLATERHTISLRQHPAILIGPSALALAGFVAAVVLPDTVLQRNHDFVLAVWVVCGILVLRVIWKAISWARAFFVVSSERMLMITGALIRKLGTISMSSVTNITVQRSLGGLLLGYGHLIVEYGGLDLRTQRIDYIPHPEEIYLIIAETIFPHRKAGSPAEWVSCPVCNGEGKIFRRASKQTRMNGQTSDDRLPVDVIRAGEDLLAQGYIQAVCPTCDGDGTVRADRP